MTSIFADGHVHLDTHATLLAVLDELVGDNADTFRGTVAAWPVGDGTEPARWSIELNDWKGNQTKAELGDHLVLTFGYLLRLSDAEYQEQVGS